MGAFQPVLIATSLMGALACGALLRGGRAVARDVTVGRSDDVRVLVTDGLVDGDIVIVSRVADGQKVRIKK